MSSSQEPKVFDSTNAEAFAGRFLNTLNHGALCLMTSVGDRTGLFDAMRELPPSTSAEIATRAGSRVDPRFRGVTAAGIRLTRPVPSRPEP